MKTIFFSEKTRKERREGRGLKKERKKEEGREGRMEEGEREKQGRAWTTTILPSVAGTALAISFNCLPFAK